MESNNIELKLIAAGIALSAITIIVDVFDSMAFREVSETELYIKTLDRIAIGDKGNNIAQMAALYEIRKFKSRKAQSYLILLKSYCENKEFRVEGTSSNHKNFASVFTETMLILNDGRIEDCQFNVSLRI